MSWWPQCVNLFHSKKFPSRLAKGDMYISQLLKEHWPLHHMSAAPLSSTASFNGNKGCVLTQTSFTVNTTNIFLGKGQWKMFKYCDLFLINSQIQVRYLVKTYSGRTRSLRGQTRNQDVSTENVRFPKILLRSTLMERFQLFWILFWIVCSRLMISDFWFCCSA